MRNSGYIEKIFIIFLLTLLLCGCATFSNMKKPEAGISSPLSVEIIKRGKDKGTLEIRNRTLEPIKIQTHVPDPVPFLLWGQGFTHNKGKRFTENEASNTGLIIDPGYNIMSMLVAE